MYCPKCGKKQEKNVEYCPQCGISLKNGYSKEDEKEITKDIVKGILTFIICFGYGFFFNIFGIFLYIHIRKDKQTAAIGVLIGSLVSIILLMFFILIIVLMH